MVEDRKFTGYDYKEIHVTPQSASFFIDSYKNFGWEIDENIREVETEVHEYYQKYTHQHSKYQPRTQAKTVKLSFKRDRKIINKMELTRLQRNFESCVQEIEKLERSKEFWAVMYSIGTGLVGVLFVAAAVAVIFMSTMPKAIGIVLAIPGVIGIVLPYFIYMREEKKQAETVGMFIEAKRDEIDEICEKGNRLL